MQMPWPEVSFDKLAGKEALTKYAAAGSRACCFGRQREGDCLRRAVGSQVALKQ